MFRVQFILERRLLLRAISFSEDNIVLGCRIFADIPITVRCRSMYLVNFLEIEAWHKITFQLRTLITFCHFTNLLSHDIRKIGWEPKIRRIVGFIPDYRLDNLLILSKPGRLSAENHPPDDSRFRYYYLSPCLPLSQLKGLPKWRVLKRICVDDVEVNSEHG